MKNKYLKGYFAEGIMFKMDAGNKIFKLKIG